MSRPSSSPMPPALRKALDGDPAAEPIGRLWDALDTAAPARPDVPNDADALADLDRRLGGAPPPRRLREDRPARPSERRRLGRMARWGALTLFVLGVAAGAWAWWQPVTVGAEAGEQVAVRLPDGSTVTLNSGSSLRYARRFETWPLVPAAGRTVRLDGEAFFEVAHTGRPFAVETYDARVEVLGTTFGVRAHRGEGGTRVTLASGRVRVRTDAESVVLDDPGASVHIPTDPDTPLRVEAVKLPQVLAWRTEGFAAVDEPLPVILAEVARRFAVEVDVEGETPGGAMSLFYPQGATAEQILHDVCLARECRFWRTSRGFALEMD